MTLPVYEMAEACSQFGGKNHWQNIENKKNSKNMRFKSFFCKAIFYHIKKMCCNVEEFAVVHQDDLKIIRTSYKSPQLIIPLDSLLDPQDFDKLEKFFPVRNPY